VIGFPKEKSPYVRPPAAIVRRVWITRTIGVLMLDAMCSDPGDWPSFEHQRATNGKEIFGRQRYVMGSMREQPMVAYANAQTRRKPVGEQPSSRQTPTEHEHCRKGHEMEQCHHGRVGPVGRLSVRNPEHVRARG
jgi:hypothetical protein